MGAPPIITRERGKDQNYNHLANRRLERTNANRFPSTRVLEAGGGGGRKKTMREVSGRGQVRLSTETDKIGKKTYPDLGARVKEEGDQDLQMRLRVGRRDPL